LSPDFLGTWAGRRTVTAADSSSSDPASRFTVAQVGDGFALLVCPGDMGQLELSGTGNTASWSGFMDCAQHTPSCAGVTSAFLTASFQLLPGPRLTMQATSQLTNCEGAGRQEMAWDFDGSQQPVQLPPTAGQP
jgi:hypothetical protein